ncbi:MAG TPA: pyridoxamine 5'-phosphate oxidase family protein [Clostridia bacterium]|nr:pyridoxamine 5'-phosphate oxidase family protein [Clostridia bacterium]
MSDAKSFSGEGGYSMRRKDREVRDPALQREILDRCKVLSLAMADENRPYVVPLSFGYEWKDRLTLYCHCATQGRKIDVLAKNPSVCFSLYCDDQIVEGPKACDYGTTYSSLIGEGTVRFVRDEDEKRAGLIALMRQYTGSEAFAFSAADLAHVAVLAIDVSALSGKRKA